MNKYILILLNLFFISCNQSHLEKEYIKNLEEKNKILEKELQLMKVKSENTDNQKNKPTLY